MSNSEANYRPGTLALHAGQEPDPVTGARAVPIYSTTSYVFHDTDHAANLFALKEFGFIYSRIMNPTCDVLEKLMAALEGGAAALAFASGQSAITAAILTIAHAGQNIISATSLYGGTWTLFTQTFRQLGIEVRFFNPDHPEEINKLVDDKTRLVYLESIGNPRNDVPDFDAISAIAHAHGLPADAEYATEYPVTVNDAAEAAFATETIAAAFGPARGETAQFPIPGAEDFSFVLEQVPGAFVFLGACPPDREPETAPTNHSARALFDDAALVEGTSLYAELALRRLAQG